MWRAEKNEDSVLPNVRVLRVGVKELEPTRHARHSNTRVNGNGCWNGVTTRDERLSPPLVLVPAADLGVDRIQTRAILPTLQQQWTLCSQIQCKT